MKWPLFSAPATPRSLRLDMSNAADLAAIHKGSFAHGWDITEFQRLLADRAVRAEGLARGASKRPIAFVLSRIVLGEAEILTLAVARAERGKGLSKALLGAHLSDLKGQGVALVHLEVEEGNAPALALYRGFGFTQAGRREAYYAKADGTRAAALTMSRDLVG